MLRLHVTLLTVLWPEKKASSGLFVFWRCQSALEPVTWQEDASSSVKASKYICMSQRIGFTRNLKDEDSGLAKETVPPPGLTFLPRNAQAVAGPHGWFLPGLSLPAAMPPSPAHPPQGWGL